VSKVFFCVAFTSILKMLVDTGGKYDPAVEAGAIAGHFCGADAVAARDKGTTIGRW